MRRLQEVEFSLFTGGSSNIQPEKNPITLEDVCKIISSSEGLKIIIENIQNLGDKVTQLKTDSAFFSTVKLTGESAYEAIMMEDDIKKYEDLRQKMKNKLAYITPSGLFKVRKNDLHDESSYTNLIPLDFDLNRAKFINDKVDFKKLKTVLSAEPFVVMACISPSGKGVKAFIRIPSDSFPPSTQYEICRDNLYPYLENLLSEKMDVDVTLDLAQAKLSQPFYFTHDADIYINYDAIPLDIDYSKVAVQTYIETSEDIKKPPGLTLASLLTDLSLIRENKWRGLTQKSYQIGMLYEWGDFGNKAKLKQDKVLDEVKDAYRKNIWAQADKALSRPYKDGISFGENSCTKSFFAGIKAGAGGKKSARRAVKLIEAYADIEAAKETGIDNEASSIIRVGNDYWEKAIKQTYSGKEELAIYKKNRITICDDYGSEFLDYIPKYNEFIIEPGYGKNYKNDIVTSRGRFFNLFSRLNYEPAIGEWETIKKLLEHVFGDQYKLGLDYFRILMQLPKHKLPILSLVSRERETGKTSFGELVCYLIGNNGVIIPASDFENDFNAHYINKNVIIVEETDNDKLDNATKLKYLSTTKTGVSNMKGVQQNIIDVYAKVVVLSNNEENFVLVDNDEIRYWVRKVPPFPKENQDPEFMHKISGEIPAFADFLLTTPIEYNGGIPKSRQFFDPNDIWTKALHLTKENNKSNLYHDLFEIFESYFYLNKNEKILQFTNLMFKERYGDILNYKGSTVNKAFKKTMMEYFCRGEEPKIIRGVNPFCNKFDACNQKEVGRYWTVYRESVIPDEPDKLLF